MTLKTLPRRARQSAQHPPRPVSLTIEQVLAWADAYYSRHSQYPSAAAGPVAEHGEETWKNIDVYLRRGRHGLPAGTSLARLLAQHRGAWRARCLPDLSKEMILAWAIAHQERTGQWPNSKSGPVAEADDLNWGTVDSALRYGRRGLPGGSSLANVVREYRRMRPELW